MFTGCTVPFFDMKNTFDSHIHVYTCALWYNKSKILWVFSNQIIKYSFMYVQICLIIYKIHTKTFKR